MSWVVMLTSPGGDRFYGEAIDRDGIRYRCATPAQAEAFKTKQDAEATFYYFRFMRALDGYQLEAVEISVAQALTPSVCLPARPVGLI